MKQLYIELDTSTDRSEEIHSDKPYSDQGETKYENVVKSFCSFKRNDDFFPYNSLEVPDHFEQLKEFFFVLIRYTESDSYHSSSGHIRFIEGYETFEEAKEFFKTYKGHRFWKGWGSTLEEAEVYQVFPDRNMVQKYANLDCEKEKYEN